MVVSDEASGRRLIEGALAAGEFGPVSIERIVPSLEDVFIHCIEAEEEARRARGIVA